MNRFGRRFVAALSVVAAASAFVAIVAAEDACILAEPSGELPRIPETRPTIIHASVVPSTAAVLSRFPSVFIVPVELADPTVEIVYAAFVDYNPLTGDGLVDAPRHSVFEASNTTARTRTLSIEIPVPLETDRCHVIEVVVALRLASEKDPKNAHTPDEPGGDVATWFYNPRGDVGGCPSLDAGIDAPAEADAADGAVQ